jgi:hypothetical protein
MEPIKFRRRAKMIRDSAGAGFIPARYRIELVYGRG